MNQDARPVYRPAPCILELGDGFYDEVQSAQFPQHILRFRNQPWAERVGLGDLTPEEWKRHFALFEPLPANLTKPLALRYHGHQFRSYNPDLGDGRGFLFAQFKDPVDGRLLDLGTKGSGTTPYSRRGDGRLTLKGAVREVLATEMLESLGVNTSKTFSIFETGESLERHDEPSPTRAGVLVRLSHGHIRFGSFQRHAAYKDEARLKRLLDYCLRHYYPALGELPENERPAAFLREVALRSADLAASWMIAGFVHGVLNTDNMNITGESFDYGPYRFLPTYDPQFTAAYFDSTGLYAYGRQPESVAWNLEQLAVALNLIADRESLIEALQVYGPRFNVSILERFVDRLGLLSQGDERDEALFIITFNFLGASQVEFEQFFHDWYAGAISRERALRSPQAGKYTGRAFEAFEQALAAYHPTARAQARLKDSYFQRLRPCSLLIDEIEKIWDSIAESDNWSLFEKKIEDMRAMGKVYGRRQV